MQQSIYSVKFRGKNIKLIQSIKKSEFARQVLMLISGASIGQLISFLSSLATSRLYTPQDFGVLAFFLSFIGIISVFAAGKYDLAIVVVKNERLVWPIIRLCRRLLIFFAVVLTIVGLLCLKTAENWELDANKVKWLPFSGLAVFLTGYTQVLYMFYTRLKKFNVLTTTRILESITLNGITILFWFSGSWGLLIGFLVAQSVSILFFSIKLSKVYREYDSAVSLFEIAKENIHYPKYNIIIGIIDMMQTQNFVLLGSVWFQTTVIGLYSFAMRLLQVPLWLIVRPIANVFFSKASENMRNNEPILPLVRKTIGSSFLLSLPFFAVLYFLGATLFALLFGEKWRNSGEIASILSLWMILDLVRTPISQIPIVLGKQKQMLFWTIFGTFISTASIIVAGMYKPNNIQASFSIITTGQCCYSLTIIIVTYFLSMKHDKSIVVIN